MSSYDKKYFAACPLAEIGDELMAQIDKYYRHLEECGRLSVMRRSHVLKHAATELYGHMLQNAGSQGELLKIYVNHYANIVNHRLSMTTDQRPSYEPKAINTDSDSMAQVKLASGLLEYYERVKKMERHTARATEYALYLGEGFVSTLWNAAAGDVYGVNDQTGQTQKEGDLDFQAHHGLDVIRPCGKSSNWLILKLWRNRYDLMARYPDLADRIDAVQIDKNLEDRLSLRNYDERYRDTDDVPYYIFFHRKTDALPQGRIVEFSAGDTIYVDGPLPYDDIPVYRIVEGEQDNSIFGYTTSFDLLPLQEAINSLVSTILTNNRAFGVQNIWTPSGAGLTVNELMGGLNHIQSDGKYGPPQPLQLTQSPAEVFTMIETLIHTMETISGVNSVVRGNPEASLQSGAALALIQAQAIQFSQGLQRNYVNLLEDTGTAVVRILQEYASTPRVAMIAGKSNRSYLKTFKGSDLSSISRVFVDMGNPLMRTTAGRTQMADAFLQRGFIENPSQYLTVVATGRLEPLMEGPLAETILIRSENERLMDGNNPPVLITDDHKKHIQEHLVVLSSPETRENPVLVETALAHIQEHIAMAPMAAAALQGQAPLPGAEVAGTQGGNPGQVLDATNPTVLAGQQVNMPEMPTNPLTGEKATP